MKFPMSNVVVVSISRGLIDNNNRKSEGQLILFQEVNLFSEDEAISFLKMWVSYPPSHLFNFYLDDCLHAIHKLIWSLHCG